MLNFLDVSIIKHNNNFIFDIYKINSSYILNKQTSNFANHFIETGHIFPGKTNTKILYIYPIGKQLNTLESTEVHKHNNNKTINLLNENKPIYGISPFFIFYDNIFDHTLTYIFTSLVWRYYNCNKSTVTILTLFKNIVTTNKIRFLHFYWINLF